MNVTVDKVVSYDVKNVKIRALFLGADKQGKLVMQAPYEWYDDEGKLLRTGVNRYTEAQLIAAFAVKGSDFAPVAALLVSFVPVTNGKRDNCHINIADDGTLTASKSVYDGENRKWDSVAITAPMFEAAIAPMTKAQLLGMIQSFTVAVLE